METEGEMQNYPVTRDVTQLPLKVYKMLYKCVFLPFADREGRISILVGFIRHS